MPPDGVKPSRAGRRGGGKPLVVLTAAALVLLVLLALAVLRPVVDRRDGAEEESPTIVSPADGRR